MTFFAVEVDYYRGGDGGAVLVPRVAFVPSWVTDPQRGTPPRPGVLLEEAPEPVREIAHRMETIVERLGILETRARASLIYRPARKAPGMTVYLDGSRVGVRPRQLPSQGCGLVRRRLPRSTRANLREADPPGHLSRSAPVSDHRRVGERGTRDHRALLPRTPRAHRRRGRADCARRRPTA